MDPLMVPSYRDFSFQPSYPEKMIVNLVPHDHSCVDRQEGNRYPGAYPFLFSSTIRLVSWLKETHFAGGG